MAPKYWMITNREKKAKSLGRDRANKLSYWTTSSNNVDKLSSWSEVSADRFKRELVAVTGKFPLKSDEEHEKQKHLTLFIHGFNNDWGDTARMYRRISRKLFTGQKSLGVCVLFTWPPGSRFWDSPFSLNRLARRGGGSPYRRFPKMTLFGNWVPYDWYTPPPPC
jgi:esterase/lipase superfamily enzyme